jgi:hypothetical protein
LNAALAQPDMQANNLVQNFKHEIPAEDGGSETHAVYDVKQVAIKHDRQVKRLIIESLV